MSVKKDPAYNKAQMRAEWISGLVATLAFIPIAIVGIAILIWAVRVIASIL